MYLTLGKEREGELVITGISKFQRFLGKHKEIIKANLHNFPDFFRVTPNSLLRSFKTHSTAGNKSETGPGYLLTVQAE